MAEKVKILVSLIPDVKKGGQEVITILNDTESAAKSAGIAMKGISSIGKSGTQDLITQKNSVEDLEKRIKELTRARDKFSNPASITRYNRKIDELTGYKKELIGTTKKLTETTDRNNNSWRVGSITVGTLLADVYRQIAARALDVVKASRQMAFEVEETASKYKTVLGPSIEKANKFIDKYRSLLALSNREAQEYVAQSVQVGKSLDMQNDKATDFGTAWVKLAGEYQSFFDIPFEEAFAKIRSGITGQFTPLKQLGIAITEAEVKERALLDTGKMRVDVLTESEKAQARFSIIMEKSKVALGNMERSEEHAASKTREMNAVFRDIAEEMATKSIPLWKEIAEAGLDFSAVLKDILGISITDKIRDEQKELTILSNQLINAVNNGSDRSALITELNEKYPDYLRYLNEEELSTEDLSKRLTELNKAYDEKIKFQIKQEALSKLISERNYIQKKEAEIQVDEVNRLIDAEKKLGIQVDYSSGFWDRRNKALEEATSRSGLFKGEMNEVKQVLTKISKEGLEGNFFALQEEEVNSLIDEAEKAFDQIEAQYNKTKEEIGFENNVETDPISIPVRPYIDPAIPVDQLLEDSLPDELPEFKVSPKIETENLAYLQNALASAEARYTLVATDEERKREKARIESYENQIKALENGISYEQQLRRNAHQEAVQLAAEYFEQINEGYQLVSQYQGAVIERRIHNIEREQDKALSFIDAKLDNDKLSDKEREKLLKQRAKAEEGYQKKIDKLQHEQFERERLASLAQVATNTAVAVSKVWGQTGIFGLGAQWPVIAMGALQAATIAAQPNPYLDGGIIEERLSSGMSSPGKKLISINENNKPEFIMNAVSTARALPLMNRMNKDPEFSDRINKAYLSQNKPQFSKPELTTINQKIDTNSLNAAVRNGIAEAMAGVKLYPKITYSEILEAERQYKQNQEAVGNQV